MGTVCGSRGVIFGISALAIVSALAFLSTFLFRVLKAVTDFKMKEFTPSRRAFAALPRNESFALSRGENEQFSDGGSLRFRLSRRTRIRAKVNASIKQFSTGVSTHNVDSAGA
jgi:hypothetical protein